jgi:DNA-binding CsgD family transcriptional regulator
VARPAQTPSGRTAACHELAARHGLTARQLELLELMANGDSTQRIAQTLSLSESTVKTYRKTLYAALDVHSRQELLDLVDATARA